jgi:flagellar biosynthesis/type III secretory pathway protein FliH
MTALECAQEIVWRYFHQYSWAGLAEVAQALADQEYSAGYSNGYNYGYSTGHTDGYNSGYSTGHTDGYNYGYSNGSTDGYNYGYSTGYAQSTQDREDRLAARRIF